MSPASDPGLVMAALSAGAAAVLLIPGAGTPRLRRVVGGRIGPAASAWRNRRLLLVATRDQVATARARVWLPGARGRARVQREAVIEAVSAVAAELRAGQPVRSALCRGLAPDPGSGSAIAPRAVVAARWGGDVAEALSADAEATGQPLLRSLSACWSVAESSGAGLADSLDRLTAGARAAEEVRVQLEAHLAAPRATARLLATLPLLGLALGLGLGGDPVGWLVGSAAGRACLAAGLALTAVGLWWTGRIAARVERLL